MTEQMPLGTWMDRVSRCSGRKEVFALLDEFRKQTWTDEECSQMGKHYIRVISNMAALTPAKEAVAAEEAEVADGPVWYEKM